METKVCNHCSKKFNIAFGDYPYKMCPNCRKYFREARERFDKGLTYKPKKKIENDKLLDTMARKDEYNAKYGTHYSYGQYMAAKENGWLKHDWSEFEDGNKSDM